jgi:hypothetical protein
MAKRRQNPPMDTLPSQWKRGPRPDPTVIEMFEQLAAAARRGQIRTALVITVDPLLKTEDFQAGDMDDVRRTLLLGGLSSACFSLTKPK